MGFFDELISWSEAYGENTAVEEYQGLTRTYRELSADIADLSLIHISEPTRRS